MWEYERRMRERILQGYQRNLAAAVDPVLQEFWSVLIGLKPSVCPYVPDAWDLACLDTARPCLIEVSFD